MAAAGAEKPAADPVPEQDQEEKEVLFSAKQQVSEARDVAREHGVTVATGTAVAGEVAGFGLQEQVRAMIMRAIERKLAALESGELSAAAYPSEHQILRGIVIGEVGQVKVTPGRKETDGEVVVVAKTALEQPQEMDGDAGAGCN